MDFAAIMDGVESFAAYVGELAKSVMLVGWRRCTTIARACWRAKDGAVSNRWRR